MCFILQDTPQPSTSQQPPGIRQPTPLTAERSHTPLPLEVLPSYLTQESAIESISFLHQPTPFTYSHLYSTFNHLEYKSISQIIPSTADSTSNFSRYNPHNLKYSHVAQTPSPAITSTRNASELVNANNLAHKPPPPIEINQSTNVTLETIFLDHQTTSLKNLTQNEATTSLAYNPQPSKYTLQSSSSSESSQTLNITNLNQGTQTKFTPSSFLQIQMPPGYKTLKYRREIYAPIYSNYEPVLTVPTPSPSPEKSQISLTFSISISTPSAANTIIENISNYNNSKYLITLKIFF